jgi:hypothetical protein
MEAEDETGKVVSDSVFQFFLIRLQAAEKPSEARRANDWRAEAYFFSTLERDNEAQRSI